jgi:hypothetical protein
MKGDIMATESERLRDSYWFALVELYKHDLDRKANGLPPLTEDEEELLRDYLIRQHAIKGYKSEAASKRASAPRKKDDRQEAFHLWDAWQKNPSIYKNKQAYIADVTSKLEVSPNAARKWFEFFMGYRLEGWLEIFGSKYPPK